MKLIKLTAVLCTLIYLAGCSTIGGKKSGDDLSAGSDGDVTIEDRSASASGIDSENTSGDDMAYGSEAQVIAGGKEYLDSVLNDPSNPLSNRVVYFEFNSSEVRQEDQPILDAHAAFLSDNPNLTLRLEGHTDERGSREYNLALGERRALSIRQILMLQGASINQFEVTSFGEERPAAEGGDEFAWQKNRRVELIYIGK